MSTRIPEFEGSYGPAEYARRLKGKKSLMLLAEENEEAVGFKVGYLEGRHFYSWMGGVVPEYRRRKIAGSLAKEQEAWVQEQGISTIRFKTQNTFKAMLLFAIKNGFRIIGTVPFEGGEGFKIVLEKTLKP